MGAVAMFRPHDLGPTVEITAFTLTGVSTLVVAVRFYCRIWVVGKLKFYDFIMFTAILCTWGLCVVNHYQLYFGSGEHRRPETLPPLSDAAILVRLIGSARSWYAYQIMYLADLALIKFSVLAFYLSIATDRKFRILVHICVGVVAVFSIIMIFINAFQCPTNPMLALTPEIFNNRASGKCFDLAPLYYSQAGFNILSDTIILMLPMPLLIALRMPRLKRLCLLAVFSAGLLVPIASCIRVWGLYLWDTSGSLSRYYGAYVIFWSQVEINTAIICASAPSLQPLYKCVFSELSRFQRSRSAYVFYDEGGNIIPSAPMGEGDLGMNRGGEATGGLELPPSTFQSQKSNILAGNVTTKFVLVREVDEEEEIRNRVRAFASYRSPAQSPLPKSPARPRDILASG